MIIAVTAHTEISEQEKAKAAGMDKVLAKPLPIEDLAKIMVDLRLIAFDKLPERFKKPKE